MKKAYHFDPQTLVYNGCSDVHKVTGYDDYILPQLATWSELPIYDVETEVCLYSPKTGDWTVGAKQVPVTAYNTQTQQPKEFDDKTLVTPDYTLIKPATQYDEWLNDTWVTNLSNQYIAEFDQVDNTRRSLYVQTVDPYISEANIKRLKGLEAEATALEQQALAARLKIQTENPWPTPPEQAGK